jgi:endonuclease YncB( thermonuclease family)
MRSRFRRWPRGFLGAAAGTAALGVLTLFAWQKRPDFTDVRSLDSPPARGACDLVRVLDRDLLLMRQAVQGGNLQQPSREFRLRLLGINVPEEFAAEVRTELRTLTNGAMLMIELDKRRMDGSGSALAHLYAGEHLVAEQLVRKGLARYEAYPGDNLAIGRRLAEAQDAARREGRGLWATLEIEVSGDSLIR